MILRILILCVASPLSTSFVAQTLRKPLLEPMLATLENSPLDSLDNDKSFLEPMDFPPEETPGLKDFPVEIRRSDPSRISIIPLSEYNEKFVLDHEENGKQPGFVEMFRNAAPYIASHRDSIMTFHVPGSIVMDTPKFQSLMDDILECWLLGVKVVIVAGCKKQVDERLAKEGLPATSSARYRIRNCDVRITDSQVLEIVKGECGRVRFEVERNVARSMMGRGNTFNGGSYGSFMGEEETKGEDQSTRKYSVVSGNFFSAKPIGILNGTDFAYTGLVRRVDSESIHSRLDRGDIVLITSLGVSPSGEVFNVDSTCLASRVASELTASKVIFFLESDGVRLIEDQPQDNNHAHHQPSTIQALRLTEAKGLVSDFLSNDDPASTYKPYEKETLEKIYWSTNALSNGVKRSHLVSAGKGALLKELYTRDGEGTLISRDLYDGIRQAKIEDITGILSIITPLIEKGFLIDRPADVIEKSISSYYVFTRDNSVVACAQLQRYAETDVAEIGCLVVSKKYRGSGRGDAMLGFLERLCVQAGLKKVFVLSTQTMQFFIERGFKEARVQDLPPKKQDMYNEKRMSKIYSKEIKGTRHLDSEELLWER